MKIRKIRRKEAGVSSVVGTLFMLSITVTLFATILYMVNTAQQNMQMANEAQSQMWEKMVAYMNNWEPGDPSVNTSDNYPSTPKNTPPEIKIVYPADDSSDVSANPDCRVFVRDNDGDAVAVKFSWYNSLDSKWINTEETFFVQNNSTIACRYPSADLPGTMYHWKVTAFDGTAATTSEPLSFRIIPP